MDKQLLNYKKLSADEANQLNPQVLAFVGDGVYTMLLRAHFALTSTAKSGKLHIYCSKLVRATAQCVHLELITPLLTEQEANIGRRARNTHIHSVAKNANIEEYKKATAFEAIFGYLYLTGQHERIYEFINIILEKEASL